MWAEHTLLIWELVILNWMWRVACEEVALLLAATINKLITTLLHYWLIDIEGASVRNSEMYWMHLTGGFPQNRGTIEVGRSCGGGYEWVEGYLPSKDICNGRISIIRIGKRGWAEFSICERKTKIHTPMRSVVLWGNFSYPNSNHWKKILPPFYPELVQYRWAALNLSTLTGRFWMDIINSYPNVFLRRWGGCLAIPQRRWGPLGPHNTTEPHIF